MSRIEDISLKLIKMSEKAYNISKELFESGYLNQDYHPKIEEIDNENAIELERIIFEIGWPTVDKVGEEASYSAWLILQHAISNPSLQRKCLPLLEDLAKKNQILPQEVAKLYDRICYFEMRPQKYGTQFDFDKNNEFGPWELEDEKNVDKYRKEVGLPPLSQSIKRMKELSKEIINKPIESYKKRINERIEWSKKVGWIK